MPRSTVQLTARARVKPPLRTDRARPRSIRRAHVLAALASLALIVPCATLGAETASASEPYAVTPISGTYMGGSTGQTYDCTYSRSWAGYRPTAPGTYPVYVFAPSMFSSPSSSENAKAVEEFAKRGFIAVGFDYPNWDYTLEAMNAKTYCPFGNQPGSVTSIVCAYSNAGVSADCDTKGIVPGGFSMGGILAQLANDFDPRVKATTSFAQGGASASNPSTMDVPWQPVNGRQLPPSRLRIQIGLMDSLFGLASPRPFLGDNEGTGVSCPYPTSATQPTVTCLGPLGNGWVAVAPGDLTPPSPAAHCYISFNDCTLPYVFDPFVWGSDPSPATHPFTLDAAADWAQATVTQGFNPRIARVIDDGVGGPQLNQANYSFFQWLWGACSACYGGGNTFSGTTNASVTLLFYGTRIDVYARQTAGSGIAAFSVDNGAETAADLYAPRDRDNVVSYSKTVPLGLHTVKVRVTGTRNRSSWGNYVGVDRFVVQ